MAAKVRRNSIYIIYEGYEEGYFLEYLENHSNVRLNKQFCNGGSSNEIIINGIKHSSRDINVYVFFDEDFESKPEQKISDDTLNRLATIWKLEKDALKGCPYQQLQIKNKEMRNPILVISHPQSLEGFLLRLLESPLKCTLDRRTTKQLKQMIEGILGNVKLNFEDVLQIQTHNEKIVQFKEEITKLKKSDPDYRERRRFLLSKITDYERRKNKVAFMRFLNDKLPLQKIIAKRTHIPEIGTLLDAFGL